MFLNLAENGFLESEFEKCKPRFRINIVEILCAPVFRKNGQVWIFGPKFNKNLILVSEFKKSKSRYGGSILEILGATISRKKRQFWTFALKFALKCIFGVGIWKIKV